MYSFLQSSQANNRHKPDRSARRANISASHNDKKSPYASKRDKEVRAPNKFQIDKDMYNVYTN